MDFENDHPEWDLNSGPPASKTNALTTEPRINPLINEQSEVVLIQLQAGVH